MCHDNLFASLYLNVQHSFQKASICCPGSSIHSGFWDFSLLERDESLFRRTRHLLPLLEQATSRRHMQTSKAWQTNTTSLFTFLTACFSLLSLSPLSQAISQSILKIKRFLPFCMVHERLPCRIKLLQGLSLQIWVALLLICLLILALSQPVPGSFQAVSQASAKIQRW